MFDKLCDEIRRFVATSPENRFPGRGEPYFADPLIGCAAAGDPLFRDYKRIVGAFHLTPDEILPGAATVICWVIPIARPIRESNRRQDRHPSREWALARNNGEIFNSALRRHLVAWIEQQQGHRAVAPQLAATWQQLADTPVGIASTWSERHAAYAAGLGTFSLNDSLITERGAAHRLGSVITDLMLPPTQRTAQDYRHNCLWFRERSCGICIGRCPAAAIGHDGHDKKRCRDYVYGTLPGEVGKQYGVVHTGCGLCQTAVPCEARIPGSMGR